MLAECLFRASSRSGSQSQSQPWGSWAVMAATSFNAMAQPDVPPDKTPIGATFFEMYTPSLPDRGCKKLIKKYSVLLILALIASIKVVPSQCTQRPRDTLRSLVRRFWCITTTPTRKRANSLRWDKKASGVPHGADLCL